MADRPGARTKRGWLRADALQGGLREQHAVIVDGIRHTVELRHDVRYSGFVTTYGIDDPSVPIVSVEEWRTFTDLPLAREKFEAFVAQVDGLTPAQS